MELGAFSVSLAVKDLAKSKAFYEALGFTTFGDDEEHNWLIMKNTDHIIGLFQGMFENNILTFNPGWNQSAEALKSFTDVRDIQKALKTKVITLQNEVDEATTGPASLTLL